MDVIARPENTNSYEDEVLAILLARRNRPAPKEPIVFYGSSSLRLWTGMAQDLGSLDVVNLGFGGGTNASGLYYFNKLVKPLAPRKIVLYFGENDISNDGLTAATTFDDFFALRRHIAHALPLATVFVLAAKQSPTKWLYADIVDEFNERVRNHCRTDKSTRFIDTCGVLLGENNRPVGRYYMSDLVHLNAVGYARWAALLRAEAGLLSL